jgi:hypothetical protein
MAREAPHPGTVTAIRGPIDYEDPEHFDRILSAVREKVEMEVVGAKQRGVSDFIIEVVLFDPSDTETVDLMEERREGSASLIFGAAEKDTVLTHIMVTNRAEANADFAQGDDGYVMEWVTRNPLPKGQVLVLIHSRDEIKYRIMSPPD